MPIKRRNGKANPLTTKPPKKHDKNGDGIKKRIPANKKLVYTSTEGLLVVKTPSDCTNWSNEFRLRIVRDFVSQRQLMTETKYNDKYVDTGYQETVYKINGKRVKVLQPAEPIKDSHYVAILRTEIVDLNTNRCMFLYHDDPAMRCLMTWAFLNEKEVAGMPKLQVYDAQP